MASRSIREFFSATAPPPLRVSGSEEAAGTSIQDRRSGDLGTCSSLVPSPKRPRSHARQTGYNKAWVKSFPWVLEVEGEGMLCRLCRKHARRPQKAVVGKTTWVDIPCVTMTLHSLRRHDTSLSHVEAKKLELQLCLSKKDGC